MDPVRDRPLERASRHDSVDMSQRTGRLPTGKKPPSTRKGTGGRKVSGASRVASPPGEGEVAVVLRQVGPEPVRFPGGGNVIAYGKDELTSYAAKSSAWREKTSTRLAK